MHLLTTKTSRKDIRLSGEISHLMLAVTSKRTQIHYKTYHFCKKHRTLVNEDHIDACNLLFHNKSPTSFNEILIGKQFHTLKDDDKKEILKHFEWLQGRLKVLESTGLFTVEKPRPQ